MKENITRIELLNSICGEFTNGVGAEVGTFRGEFSLEIVKNWGGRLYMIDVWRPLDGDYEDISNHGNFVNGVYADAMENIKGYEDKAIMIRAKSEIASTMFNDNSLDFVYIDANHAYDFVVQDIELWYPKVKSGGYLCGHDYITLFNWYEDTACAPNGKDKYIWSEDKYTGLFGVNPAVDEFCKKYNYELRITDEGFASWYIKKI